MSRYQGSGNPSNLILSVLCAGLIGLGGCWLPAAPPAEQNQEIPNEPTGQSQDPFVEIPEEPIINPVRPLDNEPVEDTQTPMTGDLDADGTVGDGDLQAFRGSFGTADGEDDFNAAADLDGDGAVTLVDFQMLIDLVAPRG